MKKPKPDFYRFHAAVTRRCLPDRLPIAELRIDPEIMEAFMGFPITNVKEYADFWYSAGYDYALLFVLGQPIPDHCCQEKIGQPTSRLESEYLARIKYDIKQGVKDEKSFEQYPWIGPEDVYYQEVDQIREHLREGMKLVVNQGPLFSGIWRIMGLETFSLACIENLPLVEAIAGKLGELSVHIMENLLQRDWVGAVWLGDDMAYTTSLMVSPVFLRDYVFPYYAQIGDLCKKYNKPFLLHSDGKFTEVFEDIISCGVAAVHPNEPTSVNITELKNIYGDRLSFIGGMDVDLMSRGTVDEVKTAVKNLIEGMGGGGGFILGGGNSITKYVPLENYKALLETVDEFGSIY